jgi:hypothetical protein
MNTSIDNPSNSTTTCSYYDFLAKVKKLEKESYVELKTSYEEAIKSVNQKETQEVSAWLMRQYFSEKNKLDYWFSSDVTEENVLLYISNSKNGFPHTISAVIEQHKLNKALRHTLNMLQDSDDSEISPAINMVGEATLKDIGAVVGNVTPTMVNKLTDKALEKYKRIYNIYHSSMGPKFVKYYNNLVEDIADSFALAFQEEETLDDALASLVASEIIKVKDLEYISPRDFKILDALFAQSKTMLFSDVEEMFITDYASGTRKILLFQYAVSRIVNPDEKSGRKKMENVQ